MIGCSVGVTVTRDPNGTLGDLIDQADSALYRSKSQGGNTLTFCQSISLDDEAALNPIARQSQPKPAKAEQVPVGAHLA